MSGNIVATAAKISLFGFLKSYQELYSALLVCAMQILKKMPGRAIST